MKNKELLKSMRKALDNANNVMYLPPQNRGVSAIIMRIWANEINKYSILLTKLTFDEWLEQAEIHALNSFEVVKSKIASLLSHVTVSTDMEKINVILKGNVKYMLASIIHKHLIKSADQFTEVDRYNNVTMMLSMGSYFNTGLCYSYSSVFLKCLHELGVKKNAVMVFIENLNDSRYGHSILIVGNLKKIPKRFTERLNNENPFIVDLWEGRIYQCSQLFKDERHLSKYRDGKVRLHLSAAEMRKLRVEKTEFIKERLKTFEEYTNSITNKIVEMIKIELSKKPSFDEKYFSKYIEKIQRTAGCVNKNDMLDNERTEALKYTQTYLTHLLHLKEYRMRKMKTDASDSKSNPKSNLDARTKLK